MSRGRPVVRLNGGLGNQLFQLHLAALLRLRGWDARVDASELRITHDRVGLRAFVLPGDLPLGGLEIPAGTPFQMARVATVLWRNGMFRTHRRLGDAWIRRFLDADVSEIPSGTLFNGNFQFHRIVDEVRAASAPLRIPSLAQPSPWYQQQSTAISAERPWALHVRRGDFVAENGLLGWRYYADAVERLNLDSSAPAWLFSDEPEAARALLRPIGLNLVDVRPPSGSAAAESLVLLASCASVISSNSTFGWWGARWCDGPVVIPEAFDPRDEEYSRLRSVDLAFPGAIRVPPAWS